MRIGILLIVAGLTIGLFSGCHSGSPSSASHAKDRIRADLLRIHIHADGTYRVGENAITLPALKERLRQHAAAFTTPHVRLYAHTLTKHSAIVPLLDTCIRAGIRNVAVSANP